MPFCLSTRCECDGDRSDTRRPYTTLIDNNKQRKNKTMKTLRITASTLLLIASAYALVDSVFYSFTIGTVIAVLSLAMSACALSHE